jgi:hypothetical protein
MFNVLYTVFEVESSWNVMAHGDAREGKWRGNWRMEWVAVLFTLLRNMVYPTLLPLMRTPRLPVVDWTDSPCRFKWTLSFRRKTKSGFCAGAITFQTQSTLMAVFSAVELLFSTLILRDVLNAHTWTRRHISPYHSVNNLQRQTIEWSCLDERPCGWGFLSPNQD